MRRPPPALRHVVTHRVAFAAVMVAALITAAFTAAAVCFVSAVTTTAARSELGGKSGSAVAISASVTRGSYRRAAVLAAGVIRGPAGPAGYQLPAPVSASLQSPVLDLPGRTAGKSRLQTQLISLPALAGHVVVVSGSCPVGQSHPSVRGGPVPACLPQAAARTLGLAAGDTIALRDPINGTVIPVQVTGVFRPLRLNGPYWLMSPVSLVAARRSSGFTLAGPLVTTPAVAATAKFQILSATWLGVPDFARLNGSGLAVIGYDLNSRINALPNISQLSDATVTTELPGRLAALATALLVTRTQMFAGLLTLLVVAGATLSLAVRLLAQQREAEAALLAARGASRVQLARRGLIDAAIAAGLSAVAGPFLGTALTPVLVRSGYTPDAGRALGQVRIGTWPIAVTWLATAGVAAGCVAIIALPWLRRPPSPLRRQASRGRQRSVAAAVYARADLAVVAVAAVAAWQLIHSAGPVSSGLDGSLSADPVLVVAPVLALMAGALLTLRALPLAARLGDRLAARGRGLAMPFAAWQISRRTLRQAGPTLVAVLAVAATVMTLAQRDSWDQSVKAQASFDVGADLRLTLPPAAPLSLGQVTGVTMAPGVTASTPAVRAPFNLPNGSLATLLALDSSEALRVIPAQAAGPSAATLRKLASSVPRAGVRIPGRPAAVRVTASLGRAAIRQSLLFVQLTDAEGIGYQLLVGALPADGRPHTLTVPLAVGGHPAYPLRITGFSLQFATPVRSLPAERLSIISGTALASTRSATGQNFDVVARGTRLLFAATSNPGATPPAPVRLRMSPDGSIAAVFRPGFASIADASPGGISVSDSYPGYGQPLPAVATRSFLAATSLRIGQRAQVSTDGVTVPVVLLAAVANLPTITNGSPGLLVDQRALQADLLAIGAQPEAITEWWLRTSGQPALNGLPAGSSATSRLSIARALLADPLSVASQQGLFGIAVAAVLLAIIGLLVSVATAGERSRDAALLDALGMPPGRVARLLGMEQALTAAATSAIGLLFGAALSYLIIPAVTLTAQAAKPVPPIAVQVPWLLAAAVGLAIAAVPTVAVSLSLPRAASIAARILEDEV